MPALPLILDQIGRSFHGQAWHGPSVLESIKDVDASLAVSRPIAGAHSIAEIVAHLEFTYRVILERIDGVNSLPINGGSWPPVAVPLPVGNADSAGNDPGLAWPALVERLKASAAQLEAKVAAFPEEKLTHPLIPGGSPAFNNFLGNAQHNAYHAGQIMLLRRAAAKRP